MRWLLARLFVLILGIVLSSLHKDTAVGWQFLNFGAMTLYKVCGMTGEANGQMMFGLGDFRQCWELFRLSVGPGDWNSVSSQDLDLELSLTRPEGPETTLMARARIYQPQPFIKSDEQAVNSDTTPNLLPVMVYYHGGGFTISHAYEVDYDETMRQLSSQGQWIVVAVEYPLAPEQPFPEGLVHCHAVTQWVAASAGTHPALLRADPTRLLVGGDSAGGNLAAVISMLARDGVDVYGQATSTRLDIAHQLLVYPALFPHYLTKSSQTYRDAYFVPLQLKEFFSSSYFGSTNKSLHQELKSTDVRVNPLLLTDYTKLPDSTLIHAGLDPLQDEGIELAQRLQTAGSSVTEYMYENQPHGFFCLPRIASLFGIQETQQAIKDAVTAVNTALQRRIIRSM